MTKIENLLRSAAAYPDASAWDELSQEFCHQGTCYPDGFFLVPHLADIAAGFAPADRDHVLIFAGQIAVDLDEASRTRYAEALATLHRLTDEWLSIPTSPQMFVYRLQAVLALEGDEVWGKELDRIVDEEAEAECPSCGTSLFVAFGKYGNFATHQDYVRMPGAERTPLLPAVSGEMDEPGRRAHTMSLQTGQESVAEALTYLFGRATCTQCSTTFRVSDQVGRT